MADVPTYGEVTTADALRSKWALHTGIIDGCVLSIDPLDSTKVKNTAGRALYVDCSTPSAPVVEVLAIPAASTTPTVGASGLASLFLVWVGVQRTAPGVGAITFATEFTATQRRRIAIIGRLWSTDYGESTIQAVTNYATPAWGAEKTLEDLACAFGGAINTGGNDFTANAGTLTLAKSAGVAFRLFANSSVSMDHPNDPSCDAIPSVGAYRYWAAAGTTYGNKLTATIDPDYYDVAGTRTPVPLSKWTIQQIYYYPGSSVVSVVYGQSYYNTLSAAKTASSSQTMTFSDVASRVFCGGVLRARVYVRQGMTDLDDAYVERVSAFVSGGASGGSAAISDHATLTNLAYADSGHTGFVPDTRTVEGVALTSDVILPGHYGGFYCYEKAIAFNIATANVYHAFGSRVANDIVPGLLSGFTFSSGGIVDSNITSESNPSGDVLRITCSAAHLLTTGDIVTLSNMNNAGHNGKTKITAVDGTTFDCDNIAYVAGAGASAGVVMTPACIKCQSGSEGVYLASFTIDGTAAFVNKAWKWELNKGLTASDNIVTERNTTNTLASMSANGHISLVAGDCVWLSGKNSTDTTDYTVRNMNLNLHKIGPLPT